MKTKNLKIYKKLSNKYVLKRFLATTLAVLTITTSLTGCFSKKNNYKKYQDYNSNNNSSYSNYTNFTNSSPEGLTNNIEINLDEKDLQIINSNLVLNNNSFDNFNKMINSLEVEYYLSDYYGVEEAFNKYKSVQMYETNHNIDINNYLEANKLYEIVNKNNELANFPPDKRLSSSELMKICNIISDVIKKHINENENLDKGLLLEKILNLKIKKYTEMSNGYFDAITGEMGFNISKISKSNDFYKKTIEHETYHFIQASSIKENNKQNYLSRMGICYKFDDLKVNSLYWDWYYEGAAEYLTLNNNNIKETSVYPNLIELFDYVKNATSLNKNYKVNSFENLSTNNNLNLLFDFFNCKTEEQKKEIIKLMYGCNILMDINSFSTSKDFFELYKETNQNKLNTDEKMKFNRELKNSIAQTLSKVFYQNLATSIENKTVSIQEVFSLISLFEMQINRNNQYYVSEYYKNEYENFYETYNQIQNSFFQIISNQLNVELVDVQSAYNAFNKNCNLKISDNLILEPEQQKFYSYLYNKYKNNKTDSINYKYETSKERVR